MDETDFRIDSSNRTLFGWSAGAMFSLYTLFNHPELFAKYLASGSPMTYYDHRFNIFRMEEIYSQKRKDLPKRLYLGTGELYPYGVPLLQEFAQTLEKRAYQGLQFKWEIIADKRHEYKAAANLLANGLDYLYGNMSIVTALRKVIDEQGIETVIAEYHRLKKDHSDEYDIKEGEINWLGFGLLFLNKINEPIEIFKLNVAEYPDSWNAYDSLGEAYMKTDDKELAIKNY